MQKNTISTFTKGAAVGMIAGAALLTVGKMVMDNNHNLSKGSKQAMRGVSELMDGIHTIFK